VKPNNDLKLTVSQPAWVGARLTVTMTVGAGGRKNSVAVHPPLPPLRPHPPAAG